jgi:hypothetical protein
VLEITFWRVRWDISWSADKWKRTKPYSAIHYVTTSKDNCRHCYIPFFSLIGFLSFNCQHHYLFAQHISVAFLLYIGSEAIFKHSPTQQRCDAASNMWQRLPSLIHRVVTGSRPGIRCRWCGGLLTEVILRSDVSKHPKASVPEPRKSNLLGHLEVAFYLAHATLRHVEYVWQTQNTSFVMSSAWDWLTQIGVRWNGIHAHIDNVFWGGKVNSMWRSVSLSAVVFNLCNLF